LRLLAVAGLALCVELRGLLREDDRPQDVRVVHAERDRRLAARELEVLAERQRERLELPDVLRRAAPAESLLDPGGERDRVALREIFRRRRASGEDERERGDEEEHRGPQCDLGRFTTTSWTPSPGTTVNSCTSGDGSPKSASSV